MQCLFMYLILQHAALKCILDKKYHILMNVNIYEKFILKHLKRYLQYALVVFGQSGNGSCEPRNEVGGGNPGHQPCPGYPVRALGVPGGELRNLS